MQKYYIYKITCLANGRVYIGQTKILVKRKNEHWNDLKNNRHHSILLQRAWNKYGEENFIHEVIETCDEINADEREKHWITYYDSANKLKGFNLDSGGNTNKTLSEDTRIKISQFHRKHYEIAKYYLLSNESLKKKSAKLSGKGNPMYGKTPRQWMDEETYKKWVQDKSERIKGENNPMFGKTVPDERKKLYSKLFKGEGNPFYGKHHTKEVKEKIRQIRLDTKGNKRAIFCINTGEKFKTITEASLCYNLDGSSISKVCRGKIKQIKGYKFQYLDI